MKKACVVLAGLAAVAASVSPVAEAATLEEVLATTYVGNPTLLAGRAQLRSTDEQIPQALSGWRPTVSVTGSAGIGRYHSNGIPTQFDATRAPRAGTLTVSQPVYRGGRTTAATNQAEANVLAGRAQLTATEQSVLLTATTAYLNVLRDEEVLKLSINNEQVLRRQLDATQERFRVGEITRTDVSQAEARLAKAIADRIGAEGSLKSSQANYLNSVGTLPDSLVLPPLPATLPSTLDEAKTSALARNPNVLAADHAHEAAREGVDLVFGELLPTVSLDADVGRTLDTANMGPGQDANTGTQEVLLNVSVPLYEGGGTYARLRAAKHTAGQRRIQSDQARGDAVEAATTAWENLESARARTRSFEAQIVASDLALAGVREESKVGSRTVLDVLNAEQELFDARVNLVKARHDLLLAAFQLKTATGDMTAQGLALPVDGYDPTRHYDEVRGKWIGGGITSEKGYEKN